MNRRPPFALVLTLLLLGLVAFAQRQAHAMGVSHEWCADHAAWAHVSCEDEPAGDASCFASEHDELSSGHESPKGEPSKEPEESPDHEHCSWLCLHELKSDFPRLASGVLVDLGLAPLALNVARPKLAPTRGRTPLMLAPKNSPPL